MSIDRHPQEGVEKKPEELAEICLRIPKIIKDLMSEGWTSEEQRVGQYPISESCFIENKQNPQRALLALKLGKSRRWLSIEKAGIKPDRDGRCCELEDEFKRMGASLVSVRYEIKKGGTAFYGEDKPDFNTLNIKVEFPCSMKALIDALCVLKGELTEDQRDVRREERKNEQQKNIGKVLDDIVAEFADSGLKMRREENKLVFLSKEEDQKEIGQLEVFADGSSTSELLFIIKREGKAYNSQGLFTPGFRPKSYPIFAKTLVEWFLSPDGDLERIEKKLLPVCEKIIEIYKNSDIFFEASQKLALLSTEFLGIELSQILYGIFHPRAVPRGYRLKIEDCPKILVKRLVNKALELSLSPDRLLKYLNRCLSAINNSEEFVSPSAEIAQPEPPKNLSDSLRALADKFKK